MTIPAIAIHHTKDGDVHYLVPPDATLLIVDDRITHDRVYRHSTSSSAEEIAALLGDSPIGHADDGYLSEHQVQAIRAAIWHYKGNEFSLVPGPVEDE